MEQMRDQPLTVQGFLAEEDPEDRDKEDLYSDNFWAYTLILEQALI